MSKSMASANGMDESKQAENLLKKERELVMEEPETEIIDERERKEEKEEGTAYAPEEQRTVTNGGQGREEPVDVQVEGPTCTKEERVTAVPQQPAVVPVELASGSPDDANALRYERSYYSTVPERPRAQNVEDAAATEPKTKRVRVLLPSNGIHGRTDPDSGEEGRPADEYACTVTVYPRYLVQPKGIIQIVQIITAIIVCAATNAEQCAYTGFGQLVLCASPTSKAWFHAYQGQGFVLFVGVVSIVGNVLWIWYHVHVKHTECCMALNRPQPPGTSRDKAKLAELVYNISAAAIWITAASVETWYASGTGTIFHGQWVVATAFAWINTILYALSIVFSLWTPKW